MDYAEARAAFFTPREGPTRPLDWVSPARRLRDAIEPLATLCLWSEPAYDAYAARGITRPHTLSIRRELTAAAEPGSVCSFRSAPVSSVLLGRRPIAAAGCVMSRPSAWRLPGLPPGVDCGQP